MRNPRKLNERHYGALQGLNKAETAEKYGDEQVKQWRRGFAVTPPELTKDDERYPGHDPRYAKLTDAELPTTESLGADYRPRRALLERNHSAAPEKR